MPDCSVLELAPLSEELRRGDRRQHLKWLLQQPTGVLHMGEGHRSCSSSPSQAQPCLASTARDVWQEGHTGRSPALVVLSDPD